MECCSPDVGDCKKCHPDLWKQMIELRNKNMTYVQIADILNLSDTTIRKYIIEYEQSNKTC